MSGNSGILEECAREMLRYGFSDMRTHARGSRAVFRDAFFLSLSAGDKEVTVEIPLIALSECRSKEDWLKVVAKYVEPAILRLALSTWES